MVSPREAAVIWFAHGPRAWAVGAGFLHGEQPAADISDRGESNHRSRAIHILSVSAVPARFGNSHPAHRRSDDCRTDISVLAYDGIRHRCVFYRALVLLYFYLTTIVLHQFEIYFQDYQVYTVVLNELKQYCFSLHRFWCLPFLVRSGLFR